MKEFPSIFNDVIGPIMIGPSSSHTAASVRICKVVRQMLNGQPIHFSVDFHKKGSLAATYRGHGSDIGLVGGMLNYEPDDPRLITSLEEAKKIGLDVQFNIVDYEAQHPNTYRMRIKSDQNELIHVTAISIGGGMFEINEVEGFPVMIKGDYYETLIFLKGRPINEAEAHLKAIKSLIVEFDECSLSVNNHSGLVVIKTQKKITNEVLEKLKELCDSKMLMTLLPILPTMSHKNCSVPFLTAEKMLEVSKEQNLELWEAALLYESLRGNVSEDQVFEKMRKIAEVMIHSIEEGLKGTSYKDRILGPQAWKIKKGEENGILIRGDVLNRVIASISALMEVKSSMGVYVAAPTGGACGALPGTIIGTALELGKNTDQITKALLAAGMIGIFIAEHATFAGETGGCQAECGSGSGMAAAGLVQLMGGTIIQAVDAASMALQNILGLSCDPVASRVEVPCLGKNVLAGSNAVSCANMALAGFDKVIPLDETITAMDQVGRMLPVELRCTELAGLSVSKTAKRLIKELK